MTEKLSDRDIRRLRRAMASVGTPGFYAALRKLLRARMPIGTFLIFRFDPGQSPVLLDAWFSGGLPLTAAVHEYLETTYRFDPFFQFTEAPSSGGLYRLPEIAPDRFLSSEYYLEYYSKTGLCDEVGLLAPLRSGARAHLSISRRDYMGPYRRREIACLKHHAPVLLELLQQHVEATRDDKGFGAPTSIPSLTDQIRTHARDTLGTHLTPREAQVAALVLQGHSNGSAALSVGIAHETCRVHRRNLYRKLSISSQRELFSLLMHLL